MTKEQPAPSPLTREEHQARAILLVMNYVPSLGYYFKGIGESVVVRLDAITLEPITRDDRMEREQYRAKLGTSARGRDWVDLDAK